MLMETGRQWKEQGHLEAKTQHYKNSIGSLPPQQGKSQPQQKALLFCPKPKYDHVSLTPQVTSQKVDIMRHTPEVTWWLWLGCWSNNAVNNHS